MSKEQERKVNVKLFDETKTQRSDMSSLTFRSSRKEDLEDIRKESRNIYNRLKSIEEDATFVSTILSAFPHFPHIGNERCGTWYIDPKKRYKDGVYFKSTDGHTGKWDFNLRRSNLHLVDAIAGRGGCIIVDSTRRGKRIPDALSKTIPIWCCTINLAVKKYVTKSKTGASERTVTTTKDLESKTPDVEPDSTGRANNGILNRTDQHSHPALEDDWDTEFHSLSSVISRSEHNQIASKIDSFAEKLLASGVDMVSIASKLRKPLRPLWFTPQSTFFSNMAPTYEDVPFWPVICLSASKAVPAGSERRPTHLYVQGSADDHELWGLGLTSELFWRHKTEILSGTAGQCEATVRRLVEEEKQSSQLHANECDDTRDDCYDWIGETGIAIGSRNSGQPPDCWETFDAVVNCAGEHEFVENTGKEYSERYLHLKIPEGKKGQRKLGECIPIAMEFVKRHLEHPRKVLIYCTKGFDRSVGIALSLLVRYLDEEGHMQWESEEPLVTKELIKRRLLYLTRHRIRASPSRATLKTVNTFFMRRVDGMSHVYSNSEQNIELSKKDEPSSC